MTLTYPNPPVHPVRTYTTDAPICPAALTLLPYRTCETVHGQGFSLLQLPFPRGCRSGPVSDFAVPNPVTSIRQTRRAATFGSS
jgi:hypothetical protein